MKIIEKEKYVLYYETNIKSNILLEKILKEKYNMNDYTIKKNINGKPYIKNNPIFISISNKNNICCIAVSKKKIGLDIEFYDKNKKYNLNILNYWFNDEEKNLIGNDIKKMLLYWTKKESYIKLRGKRLKNIKKYNIKYEMYYYDTQYINNYIFTICMKK